MRGAAKARFIVLICLRLHRGTRAGMNKRGASRLALMPIAGMAFMAGSQLKGANKEHGFAFVIVSTHCCCIMGNGPTSALHRDVLPRLKEAAVRAE